MKQTTTRVQQSVLGSIESVQQTVFIIYGTTIYTREY